MVIGIISVLFLVFVTAFFVAIEFALVSVRRTRIDQLVTEGNSGAKLVKHALEHLNTYLAAAQVGITLATIGLGTLGEPVVAQIFVPMLEEWLPHDIAESSAHGIAFVFALLLVTMIELILGETVPKIAAIQRAEATSILFIRPMRLFMLIFKPFVWLINVLSGAVLRLFGMPPDTGHGSVYTVEELEMLVTSSRQAGVLDREEEVILRRVFDFGDLTARQVMRPRTEIEGIPVTASFSELMQSMAENKHSRFPVYEGDLDNIVGVIHVRDVFEVLADAMQSSARVSDAAPLAVANGTNPATAMLDGRFNVRSIMRPIDAVPESVSVAELLERMQQQGIQMITVIDEYGGTAGIVTLEDVVEEIVGEVRDEFEPEEGVSGIVTTPEGTLIDGLVAIDDVNDALGLAIESESDTLGGYVFELLGRKPEIGDEVTNNGYTLRVEELDNLRIARVRVLPHKNADRPAAGDEE